MNDKTEAEKLAAIIAGSVYGMQSGEWDGPKEPNAGDMQIAYDILANYRLSPQVEGAVEWAVQSRSFLDGDYDRTDDGRGWSDRRGKPYTEKEARKKSAQGINGIPENLVTRVVSRTVTEWKPEGE